MAEAPASSNIRRIRLGFGICLLVIPSMASFALASNVLETGDSLSHLRQAPPCAIDTVWRFAEPTSARVARLVPEYAGSFATPESIRFFVTDAAAGERVREAFRTELTSDWARTVLPRARFVVVRYSYRQLQSWLECILAEGKSGDAQSMSLSPVTNQVSLQPANPVGLDRLRKLIVDLGIPRDAVRIDADAPHLRDTSWLARQPVICGEVRGRIVHALTGAPLAAALVSVDSVRGAVSTDTLGQFRIVVSARDPSSPNTIPAMDATILGAATRLRFHLPRRSGHVFEALVAPVTMDGESIHTLRLKQASFCERP